MQVGAQPWYLQFFWWAANIMQVVYPIALLIILGLALVHFRRLVDHIAPRESRAEEQAEMGPASETSEQELEF